MNKQTKMNSSQLIDSIERDRSTSFWLLEQVRHIDKRDLYDLMRDVDRLKQVLDLKWDETTRELRAEQATMDDASSKKVLFALQESLRSLEEQREALLDVDYEFDLVSEAIDLVNHSLANR